MPCCRQRRKTSRISLGRPNAWKNSIALVVNSMFSWAVGGRRRLTFSAATNGHTSLSGNRGQELPFQSGRSIVLGNEAPRRFTGQHVLPQSRDGEAKHIGLIDQGVLGERLLEGPPEGHDVHGFAGRFTKSRRVPRLARQSQGQDRLMKSSGDASARRLGAKVLRIEAAPGRLDQQRSTTLRHDAQRTGGQGVSRPMQRQAKRRRGSEVQNGLTLNHQRLNPLVADGEKRAPTTISARISVVGRLRPASSNRRWSSSRGEAVTRRQTDAHRETNRVCAAQRLPDRLRPASRSPSPATRCRGACRIDVRFWRARCWLQWSES